MRDAAFSTKTNLPNNTLTFRRGEPHRWRAEVHAILQPTPIHQNPGAPHKRGGIFGD